MPWMGLRLYCVYSVVGWAPGQLTTNWGRGKMKEHFCWNANVVTKHWLIKFGPQNYWLMDTFTISCIRTMRNSGMNGNSYCKCILQSASLFTLDATTNYSWQKSFRYEWRRLLHVKEPPFRTTSFMYNLGRREHHLKCSNEMGIIIWMGGRSDAVMML